MGKPVERRPDVKREMTLEELADAKRKELKLLICCKGCIFDVSDNSVYQGSGAYQMLVGKDASVALAKMNRDNLFDMLDPKKYHWTKDLNEAELRTLDQWIERFTQKYSIVAYLKDDVNAKQVIHE